MRNLPDKLGVCGQLKQTWNIFDGGSLSTLFRADNNGAEVHTNLVIPDRGQQAFLPLRCECYQAKNWDTVLGWYRQRTIRPGYPLQFGALQVCAYTCYPPLLPGNPRQQLGIVVGKARDYPDSSLGIVRNQTYVLISASLRTLCGLSHLCGGPRPRRELS